MVIVTSVLLFHVHALSADNVSNHKTSQTDAIVKTQNKRRFFWVKAALSAITVVSLIVGAKVISDRISQREEEKGGDIPPRLIEEAKKTTFIEYSGLDKADKDKLRRIPEEVFDIKNLVELDLGGHKIREISKSIGKLTELEVLTLAKNEITQLPDEIDELKKLQEFHIFNNKLTGLPPGIANLKQLQSLYLSGNKEKGIPFSFAGIEQLSNLSDLGLSNMNLSKIPEQVLRLESLSNLDLSKNNFEQLPEWRENRENLNFFDISDNKFDAQNRGQEWFDEFLKRLVTYPKDCSVTLAGNNFSNEQRESIKEAWLKHHADQQTYSRLVFEKED